MNRLLQAARRVLLVGCVCVAGSCGPAVVARAGSVRVGRGAAALGLSAETVAVRSPFRLPVAGPAVVLRPFSAPRHRWNAGNRGVDLAAPAGAPVLAAAAGTVAFAGSVAGRPVVSVRHPNGLRSTYEPVAAAVRAGQPVTAGEFLGRLQAGRPECAPAVCLHWGIRLPDGAYLDPMVLLTGLPVVLLPWAEPG